MTWEARPPHFFPSSPRPSKNKLGRQPLEEMHVDIFINQKRGDQSPRTFSLGTAASPNSPKSNSSTCHTASLWKTCSPPPSLCNAASALHPFPGPAWSATHPGPLKSFLLLLAQSRRPHDYNRRVSRLDHGLANGIPESLLEVEVVLLTP